MAEMRLLAVFFVETDSDPVGHCGFKAADHSVPQG